MGRKEARFAAAMEKNAIVECSRIQRRFVPGLMDMFSETKDPRNQSYITYSNRMMLSTLYHKGLGGVVSMQDMTGQFNKETVTESIFQLSGEKPGEYLPHYVTINEYLERLEPKELEEILHRICRDCIRRKSFDDARYKGRWLVIIDGTRTYSGPRRIHEHCLETHHNKGTEAESVCYHTDVLEAKIYLGENLLLSMGSEFIENGEEYHKSRENQSEESYKQDCEKKAFQRLAAKLKKRFPRLPIVILADSLYASEPVMQICEGYGWEYIIRFKDGSIPSIAEEYENIPEKGRAGAAEFVNDIDYKERKTNVLRYTETRVEKGKAVETQFQWLTSLRITTKNAEKTARTGRLRWKIENEGFNRQKNWQGDITHACSHNANALKNHYLIYQIADFIKQLYEWFFLNRMGIKKKQKDISPDLLASFGRHLTAEDISSLQLHKAAFN